MILKIVFENLLNIVFFSIKYLLFQLEIYYFTSIPYLHRTMVLYWYISGIFQRVIQWCYENDAEVENSYS